MYLSEMDLLKARLTAEGRLSQSRILQARHRISHRTGRRSCGRTARANRNEKCGRERDITAVTMIFCGRIFAERLFRKRKMAQKN